MKEIFTDVMGLRVCRRCIAEVSKTVNNIDSVYVKDFKVHVHEGSIKSYGVICKVSFRVGGKDVR